MSAGLLGVVCATGDTAAGVGSVTVATTGGFSVWGVAVGVGVAAGAVVATGDSAGAGGCFSAGAATTGAAEAGAAAACGEAVAAVCRAIAPVTESRPCSRTPTREYSRSRSLFSVSMAEARRRASFWPSLATVWICCDCRTRSAAAIWSRRHPIDDWLASIAMMTAPTEATAHDPSRQSACRSNWSSSARKPDITPPVFSVLKLSARLSAPFAIGNLRPPEAQPNHSANINRK